MKKYILAAIMLITTHSISYSQDVAPPTKRSEVNLSSAFCDDIQVIIDKIVYKENVDGIKLSDFPNLGTAEYGLNEMMLNFEIKSTNTKSLVDDMVNKISQCIDTKVAMDGADFHYWLYNNVTISVYVSNETIYLSFEQ